MGTPDISVVIPTYRRPALLLTCLRFLENQSLAKDKYEVIVVSDGTDLSTMYAVLNYKTQSQLRLTFMNTMEKKGPAAARNMGWQHSSAPLVAFTDDDCQPHVRWLETFADQFNQHVFPEQNSKNQAASKRKYNTAVVFSGYTRVPIEKEPTDFALNTHGLQYADFITANCACSRMALRVTGGFDERFGVAWREDSDLEFNFIQHNIPVIKVNDAVVIHPVREAPWGVSIKEQKKGLYDALLFKKFPEFYRKRLSPNIIYDFYFIVLVDLICLIAILSGWWYIAAVTFAVVFLMIFSFFLKRIKRTKKTISHIWEMWVTSMVLPFLSVYWRIYGAVKFRVLFF